MSVHTRLFLKVFFSILLIFIFAYAHSGPPLEVYPLGKKKPEVSQYQKTSEEMEGDTLLTDVIKRFPGATVRSYGNPGQQTSVRFRGLRSANTLVLVDGMPANNHVTGDYDFGNTLTDSVGKISMISNSETILYGPGTLGNVLSIETRQATNPNPNRVLVEGGSFQTARVYGSKGIAEESYNAIAHVHGFRTAGLPQYEGKRVLGEKNKYHNYGGSFFFNRNMENKKLSMFFKNTTSALRYDNDTWIDPLPLKPMASQRIKKNLVGMRLTLNDPRQSYQHRFFASVQRQESDWPRERYANEQTSMLQYGGTAFWNAANTSKVMLQTQNSFLRQERGLRKDITTVGGALWHEIFPIKPLSVSGGVRADRHQVFGNYVSYSGEVRYQMDKTRFHVGGKRMRRAPCIGEYFSTFMPDNPDLKPEKGFTTEVGVQHSFSKKLSMGSTYFMTRTRDMILYRNRQMRNAERSIKTRGLENFIHFPVGEKFKGEVVYTFIELVKNKGPVETYIPRHQLSGTLSGKISENWKISGSGEWVSARKNWGGQILNNHTLARVQVDYRIRKGWTAYIKAHNVFDENYRLDQDYRTPRRAFYVGTRLIF